MAPQEDKELEDDDLESGYEEAPAEPPIGWTEALGPHAANPPAPVGFKPGEPIIALGEEWCIPTLENRIKAQFEQWVRKNAKIEIALAEKEDGPEEAERLRTIYSSDTSAAYYKWYGKHVMNALTSVPGQMHIFYRLLARNYEEMTEDLANQIFEDSPKQCIIALRWSMGGLLGNPPTPDQVALATKERNLRLGNMKPKTMKKQNQRGLGGYSEERRQSSAQEELKRLKKTPTTMEDR